MYEAEIALLKRIVDEDSVISKATLLYELDLLKGSHQAEEAVKTFGIGNCTILYSDDGVEWNTTTEPNWKARYYRARLKIPSPKPLTFEDFAVPTRIRYGQNNWTEITSAGLDCIRTPASTITYQKLMEDGFEYAQGPNWTVWKPCKKGTEKCWDR